MSDAPCFFDLHDLPGPVIAAVTFDGRGRHCLRQALLRAARTGQPVIALHILHETAHTAGHYRRNDRGEVLRPNADVARRLLGDFSAEIVAGIPEADGVALRQLIVEGTPQRRIPEVARLTGAGVIIIGGDTGRPLLTRLLGRNTASAVQRRAACPVVVIDRDGNTANARGSQEGRRQQPLPSAMQAH